MFLSCYFRLPFALRLAFLAAVARCAFLLPQCLSLKGKKEKGREKVNSFWKCDTLCTG
jgi:hypothetical protein